jgi:outer membrane autotransporter protein
VNLDDSTLTGNITNSGSGTLTVGGSNGSILTSDVTNSGGGALVISLDTDSHGTGAWNGGSLNIIDDKSTWGFTGDSTLDNISNSGTIQLGGHDNYVTVEVGNIEGDGTWIFPVDSDTGKHSTVLGDTDANSHPTGIIDARGNGQLDPNDIVKNLVLGANANNWQWADFDWGLEEYYYDGTVSDLTRNGDAVPHFARKGISTVGAVLNSSNALQQTMWFAQQNSLLKRLGELRFNQFTTSAASDKEVVTLSESLLSNVWIRSYGQQLNVGGKVAGKAYEQLVYGVDLGTDHKWQLDANNALYLGVYAGYGQSDVDYRIAGAKAELNSYYGGLYATWLHDSGFYADVTFKVASVDNELNAPYSQGQLSADYNDVNIGGSIELGKKFTFKNDWFIEPQFQVNYLHILAEDYTAGPLNIKAADLDAIQFRVGTLFGRTIKLANGGAIQPYLKVSGVESVSTGGEIKSGYQTQRPNIDGARAELGGGIIWQLDAHNQLHLDYEASFGDKYDKPWGLTAGYRYQF